MPAAAAHAITMTQPTSPQATSGDSAESESAEEADCSSCSNDESILQHAAQGSTLHSPADLLVPQSCGVDLASQGRESGALSAQGIRQRYPKLFEHAAAAEAGHPVLDSQAGTTGLTESSATALAEGFVMPELTQQRGRQATAPPDTNAPALMEQSLLDLHGTRNGPAGPEGRCPVKHRDNRPCSIGQLQQPFISSSLWYLL